MYRFQKEQRVFGFGACSIGGQPGRSRTLMIGSLFYPSHSIVSDRNAGIVNEDVLKEKVAAVEAVSQDLGQPCAYMVYAETAQACRSYLEKVADITSAPIFLESPSKDVKKEGMAAAKEMGISSRIVYNSLSAGSDPGEWASLREHDVDSAVILAFNPADISTKGRIYLLDDGANLCRKGLLDMAEENGISRPLIDTASTGFDQMAGTSLRSILVAKAKWGVPCGCALHNSVETWGPFLNMDDDKKKLFRYVDTASVTLPIMSGADFVMYGPIESGSRALHLAAFTDSMLEQSASEL